MKQKITFERTQRVTFEFDITEEGELTERHAQGWANWGNLNGSPIDAALREKTAPANMTVEDAGTWTPTAADPPFAVPETAKRRSR